MHVVRRWQESVANLQEYHDTIPKDIYYASMYEPIEIQIITNGSVLEDVLAYDDASVCEGDL
jgi:hypothetical protein